MKEKEKGKSIKNLTDLQVKQESCPLDAFHTAAISGMLPEKLQKACEL